MYKDKPSFISINPRQEWPEKFSELWDIDLSNIDWKDESKTYAIKFNSNPSTKLHGRFFSLVECVCWSAPAPTWPNVSLASPEAWTYVMWQSIWPINLNATTTKWDNDIQSVEFFRWSTSINTIDPATAWWAVETYADAGPFTSDQTWHALVTDVTWLSNVSNNIWIHFSNYFYYGMSPNTTLTESDIIWLEDNTLRDNYTWVYALWAETWSYKYFARPTRLWQPSDPTVDFIDNDTNFPVPFQLQTGTISITNSYGFTEDYYVYRSVNVLGGAMNIRIQP